MHAFRLIAAVTVAAVVICGCQGASTDETLIEFSRVDDRVHAIYTVSVETGRVRRIARDTELDAAWSPDGRRLAFFRTVGAYATSAFDDLYVIDADGSNKRRLGRFSGGYGRAAWSPDGKLIAFDRCTGGIRATEADCAIAIMTPDGSGLRRVGRPGVDGEPVWSPDGESIAFAVAGGVRRQDGIFVVDVQTSHLRRLTTRVDDDPRWSPDGRSIAFTRTTPLPNGESRTDIYVVAADGHRFRRLTRPPVEKAGPPSWSPDGTRIAFDALVGGVSVCGERTAAAIYIQDIDRQRTRRVTPYRPMYSDTSWSTDGKRIAYVSLTCRDIAMGDYDEYAISVMNADGSHARRLGPRARTDFAFAWQPQVDR